MNFKSLVNEIGCDGRIKNGTLDLKNEDHVFVLQEYLEKAGYDINEIVEKTAGLFEAGRFPDRQAYNTNGILVTFPTKQYRDRAVNKGTHFAENPKKNQANIFNEPGVDASTKDKPNVNVPIDQTLDKNIGDTNTDDRLPKEKQQDAVAIQNLLIEHPPHVNYSVDEAKMFGFYKKGYSWYDVEGTLIGEQIYDESLNSTVIRKEANLSKTITKSLTKLDVLDTEFAEVLQILKNGSLKGTDNTFKTDIYETIPLLVLYDINFVDASSLGKDSVKRATDFLSKIGNLKTKLQTIKDPSIRDENIIIYDEILKDLNDIGGKGGISLKTVFDRNPTDFIHDSIDEFYKSAKTYDLKFKTGDSGKTGTADIVLIYGGSKTDILNALDKGEIENYGESIVKIKNKEIYFALISLKALSGRVGKVLTQLSGYLNIKFETSPSSELTSLTRTAGKKTLGECLLTESYLQVVKNTFNKFIDTYSQISDSVKEKYRSMIDDFSKLTGGFLDKLKFDLFNKLNADVNSLQKNSFIKFKEIEDKIESEIGDLNEADEICDKILSTELTPSLKKNLEDLAKLISTNNTDTILIEKIITTSKNPSITKYFKFEINESDYERIKNIKHDILLKTRKIVSSKETCVLRSELSPILKYRGNILALQCLNLIMSRVLQDTNQSDPDKIQQEFINLSSVLSTEAIFGGNVSLPLIKYTGDKLERLGYKSQFILKVPDTIPDLKLGKLTVRLEPEAKAYMVIYLYLFCGIGDIDDNVTPIYLKYELRSDSGSAFSFKVEGNDFIYKI